MSYFSAALTLAGAAANVSDAAVDRLDLLEATHGVVLPAAVREWYSRPKLVDLLAATSSLERIYPIRDFGYWGPYWRFPGGASDQEAEPGEEASRVDPLALGLLPFMEEDQGVWFMVARLNGADDPPLVVSFDVVGPEMQWQPHVARFSDLIYTRLWDVFPDGFSLSGRALPVTQVDLTTLGTELQQMQSSFEVPAGTTFRYADRSGDQRVLLVERSPNCWDITLWSAGRELLKDLAARLGSVSFLPELA